MNIEKLVKKFDSQRGICAEGTLLGGAPAKLVYVEQLPLDTLLNSIGQGECRAELKKRYREAGSEDSAKPDNCFCIARDTVVKYLDAIRSGSSSTTQHFEDLLKSRPDASMRYLIRSVIDYASLLNYSFSHGHDENGPFMSEYIRGFKVESKLAYSIDGTKASASFLERIEDSRFKDKEEGYLLALAMAWNDDDKSYYTLREAALSSASSYVREEAIRLLSHSGFFAQPSEDAYQFLKQIVLEDKLGSVHYSIAIEALPGVAGEEHREEAYEIVRNIVLEKKLGGYKFVGAMEALVDSDFREHRPDALELLKTRSSLLGVVGICGHRDPLVALKGKMIYARETLEREYVA